MRAWLTRLGLGAVGALVALAALAVVHRALMPVEAALVGLLTMAVVAAVGHSWSHLPAYVRTWLDLGVALASAALGVVAHATSWGVAFTVLRGPELAALSGAAGLLAVTVAGLAYTHLRLAAEVEAAERRMAELQRAALQSRLAALSAQINPHFLFNTLNTLAEVVHEDEDAAEDLVTDLAAMMRTALRSSSQQVPLAAELDTCRRLLRIESARLRERLEWSIEGTEHLDAHDVHVPGLLVQPLVENAVKYGVATRTEGGRVQVLLAPSEHGLTVTVRDDGPGLPAEIAQELADGAVSPRGTEDSGGGLHNCAERLRLTWPDGAARLRHHPTPTGTTLVLELPVETR